MPKSINLLFLPISILCLTCTAVLNSKVNAGITNGADIYCFMRNGGNNHEPSWEAAYESIKNKKPGLFKTSPKQAAATIVEIVVEEPEKYKSCIKYLGDLYSAEKTVSIIDNEDVGNESLQNPQESDTKPKKGAYVDRYSY